MNYMKKIMNLLIKNGKKGLAVKAVNKVIEKIRKKIPPSRINRVFERLLPSVKIHKKKVSGKVYQIPAVISENRAQFQVAKWVVNSLKMEKRGKSLVVKLVKIIINTARKRGNVWKQRKQFLTVIKENRSYMRFIRKKRKKKKKFVFQQRFTKVITRNLEKESKIAEKINNEKDKKTNTKNKKQFRKNKRVNFGT